MNPKIDYYIISYEFNMISIGKILGTKYIYGLTKWEQSLLNFIHLKGKNLYEFESIMI
jgi:hypothetical protein